MLLSILAKLGLQSAAKHVWHDIDGSSLKIQEVFEKYCSPAHFAQICIHVVCWMLVWFVIAQPNWHSCMSLWHVTHSDSWLHLRIHQGDLLNESKPTTVFFPPKRSCLAFFRGDSIWHLQLLRLQDGFEWFADLPFDAHLQLDILPWSNKCDCPWNNAKYRIGSEFAKDMMQSHVVVKNCHRNPNFGMKSNGCRSKNQEKLWLRCTVCHLPFVSLCRKTWVFIRTFHWSCFATSACRTRKAWRVASPWRCWSRTCVYFLCYACPMAEKVRNFPCGVLQFLHGLFETLASDNLFALLTTQFLQIAKNMYTDFISSCLPSMYFWSFGWI